LSYYTPQKPAPSLPLATNLGIATENILSFYFLQYFQRSLNTNFCSLTASLSFITYDSETSTEEGNALVLSILDIPFLLSLGISSIVIDVSGDESNEEVPQAIPLYPNADGTSLFYISNFIFES
jgi:hypothetical protein